MTPAPLPVGGIATIEVSRERSVPLAEIRAWVRALVGPSNDLELVVTELVANATEHGEADSIAVEIERAALAVKVSVTNEARPLPPVLPSPDEPRDSRARRGRGLMLARAIADDVIVAQNGSLLVITAWVALG